MIHYVLAIELKTKVQTEVPKWSFCIPVDRLRPSLSAQLLF